jgi:hypothetical protein
LPPINRIPDGVNNGPDVHLENARKAIGATLWDKGLTKAQQTALVDVDYNVKGGLAKGFPTLVKDVKQKDFVKAGFDLVNAKRTTQAPGLKIRTEADFQALLLGHERDLAFPPYP